MGFSGGGSSVTKPHTHSNAIVQDGGALNFSNVTQAGMAAGDLTYSNGTALQILNLGNATETLTVNGAATAPEWVAAGGATFSYVASGVAAGSVSEISVDFSAISQDDISALMVIWSAGTSSNTNMMLRVNGVTSADYDSDGAAQYGGGSALVNWSGQTGYEHSRSELGDKKLTVVYLYPNTNFDQIIFLSHSAGNLGSQTMSGFLDTTETDFDNITLVRPPAAGATLDIGSRIDVYKIANS